MQVVSAFETERGARLTDVSPGGTRPIGLVLAEHGIEAAGALSADLIARGAGEDRIIEVKHRALPGPFRVRERQIDTFRMAKDLAWLYLVFDTTQPHPVELWIVQDPFRLPWVLDAPALREPEQARGVRHEAAFCIHSDDVCGVGKRVEIDGLDLPTWAGSCRD
jgi:hypothetical protein